jgi:hypothetical protein
VADARGISIPSPATKQQNLKVETMKIQHDSNTHVGYGRPPAEHQFRPGQSGNPSGRPKGARGFKSDLRDELGELISISDDDNKTIEVTKQRAIIKTLLRMAIAGDPRAIATIVGSCARAFGEDDGDDETEAPEDHAIMQAATASQRKPGKRASANTPSAEAKDRS